MGPFAGSHYMLPPSKCPIDCFSDSLGILGSGFSLQKQEGSMGKVLPPGLVAEMVQVTSAHID